MGNTANAQKCNIGLGNISIKDLGGLLFQDDHGHAKVHGCVNAGRDAGAFNGKNLSDACIFKVTGKFFADLIHKLRVYLMIDEAVHFQCRGVQRLALGKDFIFQ